MSKNMFEYQYIANRPRPMSRASKIKFALVLVAMIWVSERDWDQLKEIDALENVVVTQAQVIAGMEHSCPPPPIELSLPI